MEIWLVRHGQTSENLDKLIQGHRDGKLSGMGIIQSKLTGTRLEKTTFDHIYVSDLGRTRETFQYLFPTKKDLSNVTFTRLIREKNGGVLEGKKSIIWDTLAEQSKLDLRQYKCEGAESWEDVFSRAKTFLKYLIDRYLRKKQIDIADLERKLSFSPLNVLKDSKSSTVNQPKPKFEEEKVQRVDRSKSSKENIPRPSSVKARRLNIFGNDQSNLISKAKSTKKILVVSHGGFIMELFNVMAKNLSGEKPKLQGISNCSLSVIRFTSVTNGPESKVNVEFIMKNDISHLESLAIDLS